MWVRNVPVDMVFTSEHDGDSQTLEQVQLVGVLELNLRRVKIIRAPEIAERNYGAIAGMLRKKLEQREIPQRIQRLWQREPMLREADTRTLAAVLSERWDELSTETPHPDDDGSKGPGNDGGSSGTSSTGGVLPISGTPIAGALPVGAVAGPTAAPAPQPPRVAPSTGDLAPVTFAAQAKQLGLEVAPADRKNLALAELGEQFGPKVLGHELSPEAIKREADVDAPITYVIELSLLAGEDEDGAYVYQRLLNHFKAGGSKGASRPLIAVRDAATQEQADEAASQFLAQHPTSLTRDQLAVIPGAPAQLFETLEHARPGSTGADRAQISFGGPREWLVDVFKQAVLLNVPNRERMRSIAFDADDVDGSTVASAGAALIALVETTVRAVTDAGGKQDPNLAILLKNLRIDINVDGIMTVERTAVINRKRRESWLSRKEAAAKD